MASPDRERARGILNHLWQEVSDEDGKACSREVSPAVRVNIAELLSSEAVSFAYSSPTQLLGKATHPELDCLCLQRGENEESQWDPRSFAASVVVPWVDDNEHVLGTSKDPYVSNPLRQARVVPNPPNVRTNTLPLWQALHEVLSDIEARNDPNYTLAVLREVLRQTHEILKSRQFNYPKLTRVSLEQTLLLVRRLLEASREGEHGMSLAAALFKVIGRRFGLWDEVRRQARRKCRLVQTFPSMLNQCGNASLTAVQCGRDATNSAAARPPRVRGHRRPRRSHHPLRDRFQPRW